MSCVHAAQPFTAINWHFVASSWRMMDYQFMILREPHQNTYRRTIDRIHMPLDFPKPKEQLPLLRILASHLAIVSVFNFVAAIVATYAMHLGAGFFENLVFSLCVGTIAWLLIDGGRMLLWGVGMPPRLPFIALVFAGMPTAKYLGNHVAIRMLGLSSENVAAYQSRNTTGMVILTVLACVAITWFFWRRGEMALLKATIESEKARAADIEKQATQAQLQLLQAQIEPHMLFNTLANLQGMIAIDPPRAQHVLDHLIQYLRATLTSSRSEKTTLAHEFTLMEAYLGLMSVRMGKRLAFSLQLPEALRTVNVPPMLLQPLVENAIKHGLEPKIDGGSIDVSASEVDGVLTLSVIDTGLGLDAPHHHVHALHATHSTHIGLENVRERLQVMFGDRASLTLTPNKPSGVVATLTLPSQS